MSLLPAPGTPPHRKAVPGNATGTTQREAATGDGNGTTQREAATGGEDGTTARLRGVPENAAGTRHLPEAPTGIRALARGGGLSAHRHDNPQLIYAQAGVIAVLADAGIWLAFPGRALWVPGGVVHEHRAFGAADLRLVGIPQADDPIGVSSPVVLGVDPLLRELVLAITAEPNATNPDATEPTATNPDAAEPTATNPDAAEPNSTASAAAERDRLGAVLLDRTRRAPRLAGQYVPAARDPRLAAVCRILLDDPAEPAGLAELGARVGAGERTLSRLFARELGMSFPRWRVALRLHHALILLAEGEPVTAVAHRCGWSSASAFIDAYRRTFGHTPGAARRDGWPR